ncbi:MAG TPA: hypothetical protein VET89_00775 [Stellaceae bacterium]|nr:hypothetical protein [Stellaceae bacterium]
MTTDELYIVKTNIANFQAMLKLDISDEKRFIIKRLLAEAEEELADLKAASASAQKGQRLNCGP